MTLALYGGKPVRDTFLAYGKQAIDEQDIQAVVEVLRGNYLTTGPLVGEFEKKVAEYVGAKYAVAVSNGTAALHAAMFGCGIGPGDEIIVTPLTFAATVNAIVYIGAIPVFADISEETYNIDVKSVVSKITSKTKAIVPVHFAGQPVDITALQDIAKTHNLKIIEDGAHALGSEYKGQKVGSFADATTFSFHPVKPITTGEGGIITTNDEEVYKRMLLFRSHGITREHEDLKDKSHGNWYYEQQLLGYNYRLTDIQAALGISQMDKLDSFIERRREIARIYNEAFKDLEGIRVPYEAKDCKSGYHIYVVQLNNIKASRDEVYKALISENIGVNVHYIPVYYHPYYQERGYKKGICPIMEEVYEKILTLPLYPTMTQADVESVIEGVKKVINFFSK